MFKVGPIGWENPNQSCWDEKGHTMISAICISFNQVGIKSIQFRYLQEGDHVLSEIHGSSRAHVLYPTLIDDSPVGEHFKIVRLGNDEYLTGLSCIDHKSSITSLTFHTNKRKYGPFCKRYSYLKSCKKEIDAGICDRSEFGGLFGSFFGYGGYLVSIGMYVSPITSNDTVPGLSLIPTTRITTDNRTLDCQSPKMVDGFPVKHIRRYKPKLKDRIRSKLQKAISFLIDLFV